MNKILTVLALITAFASENSLAHPGRTASDGCHYCRTNCDRWGETQGTRHCHGSGLKAEPGIQTMENAAINQQSLMPENALTSHSSDAIVHPHDHPEEQYN